MHWKGGAFYPIGGPGVIPFHVVKVIEKYGNKHGGGRVLVRAPVSSIVVEGGRAVGVVVKGNTIRAPLVISSVGAPLTINTLLPADVRDEKFKKEVAALKREAVAPAMSLMSLFVGINGDAEELKLSLIHI